MAVTFSISKDITATVFCFFLVEKSRSIRYF